MKDFDLAIIGSGPGGYIAALYASRRGFSVCVFEKGILGGTCLNRGCIPTKYLLNGAAILKGVNEARRQQIASGELKLDYPAMALKNKEIMARLGAGIETLFRANKIELFRAHASVCDRNIVEADGIGEIRARNIIIASGSVPAAVPGLDFDHEFTLSSDDALALRSLPESIAIVGGGVIGCEFASFYNAMGVKVTVIEALDRLVASQSREVSKRLEGIYKRRGIDILCSSKVTGIDAKTGPAVFLEDGRRVIAEKVVVAVGRIPQVDGLGDLKKLGVSFNRGGIVVDSHMMASANIYAIGDCAGGPLLAHKASYDGMLAVDNILGEIRSADYSNIPNLVWTDPEIASIGPNEDEAKAGIDGSRTVKFPYLASGKAYLTGKVEGFIKITGDRDGKLVGVEIFGEGACELIGEACLAKTVGIKIDQWARVVHGHPTLSEMFQEAAHIYCGTPIHSL